MSDKKRLFGTFGVRRVANEVLTPEFASRLAACYGSVVQGTVAVGGDTRTSSPMLMEAVKAGLLSSGCDVVDLGILPTPGVQYGVRKYYDGGVMITASHNPPKYNGIKFLDELGIGIPDEMELEIEKLYFEEKNEKPIIHLKFKGKEEIVLNNPIELNNYLSSGTVKGMITFTLAQEVLKDGGCLIVDEVENHFNKEIVSTLIRFFMDGKINKNGGMLIFSTHYPELLDEYDRNDSIFITRNRDGITAENLSNILKRNDIKKSDAYQSGFLEGTTPTYEAYMQLKKSIAASLK